MRTNQHDAHELCGHSDAQSGSATAMTRAAWSSGREIDCHRLAAIASPASDLPYAVRVCADLRVVKVPTSLGGPLPLPYTRRAKRAR